MTGAPNPRDLRGASLATLKALARQADPKGVEALLATMPSDPDDAALCAWRGRVDAAAVRLRYTDPVLFASQSPSGAARQHFSRLEQCRCEALGCRDFAGVRENLRAVQGGAAQGQGSGDHVINLVRARLVSAISAQNVSDDFAVRLDRLAALIADQRAFGEEAARLAAELAANGVPAKPLTPDATQSAAQPDRGLPRGEMKETSPREGVEATHAGILRRIRDEPRGRIVPARGPADETGNAYRIFTTQYDATLDAGDLCDDSTRRRLNAQFDAFRKSVQPNIARWAARLQRHLLSRQVRSWTFDCEEGLLDCGRLARIVVDASQPLTFKQEREAQFPGTALTLLIDNSGSMRGVPISMAATCAWMLATTLERCGIATEVLGFTTRRWRGGRAREQWVAANRPAHPGRLTELLHVIYKPAEGSWRGTRRHLASMLEPGLLKENVDGEAIRWAHARIMKRPQPRRILMVISDGAPLDEATLAVNDAGYLERDLRRVIADVQTRSPVELLAIGIGHDVGSWYSSAFTISGPVELGEAMVRKLVELLTRDPKGRRSTTAMARRTRNRRACRTA
ncbi:cobaltochelatase CobT [Povalibacter uvarum]|uniref:Cobaltochelatase CobT n=1 Tax=Povalibacter uvarum TaxID=732238 RepID=A0A841HT13_9GAMM|nr:cobaltochelatase subunit CobT [Povalibacter uvarum]MBB6096477.1 cobaltochelatase CobT [Povalibacter uvarum]